MKSLTWVGLFEPAAAEALAAMAIQLARELGLSQINMEGDAKMITEAVKSNAPHWSKWGHLIDDIRYRFQNFTQWTMAYVKRDANQAAHMVARMATAQVLDRTWNNDFPECIHEFCRSERAALTLN